MFVSQHLYVLDFRSSCPDWQAFLILRLIYTFHYEDLNDSRKIYRVLEFQ